MSEKDMSEKVKHDGKRDSHKPRYSLLPWHALDQVARLMTESSATHGDRDYLARENASARYREAAMRHLAAIFRGEEIDESGFHHLAHLAADALIALELEQ
jgi:hypothetical protein